MQELITLALYAATLVGMLFGATPAPQTQPYVFAAGTGHQGLECVACHHVHAPVGEQPLWMTPVQPLPEFAFFKPAPNVLDGSSLLCLSCHDGAIAPAVSLPEHAQIISQIGRSVSATGGGFRFPMGSHPVGVRYNPANPRLVNQPGFRAGLEMSLPDGRVECVSCHNPHGTSGHKHLLVVSDRRSQLCLSCHRI